MSYPRKCVLLFCLLLMFCLPSYVSAKTYTIKSPADKLFDVLKKVKAGDKVIVHKGTYQTPGFYTVQWDGTAQQPIVIEAAAGERPIIRGQTNQNVININGSHFTFRGFEITNGSHGLRLYKVDHAVIEDMKIHKTASVGISCNASTSRCDVVTLRGNEIFDTAGHGEGMYLGCNNAACVMSRSIIEGNYIHDLGGSQGDGIELKTGSWGNVVRDNVIVNAKYPAITLYGFQEAAGRTENIIERNFIYKTVDNGIQVVGQVIVRNNIIVNAGVYGIHSKASQGFNPHSVKILHNTIYKAKSACLKTNNWSGQKDQLVANNAFYCAGGQALNINGGAPAAQFFNNVILGSSNYNKGTIKGQSDKADLGDPAKNVFYPPAGSKLLDAALAKYATQDDFEGRVRGTKPDVGAYERDGAKPNWAIKFGFKPAPQTNPQPTEQPTNEPLPEPVTEPDTQEPAPAESVKEPEPKEPVSSEKVVEPKSEPIGPSETLQESVEETTQLKEEKPTTDIPERSTLSDKMERQGEGCGCQSGGTPVSIVLCVLLFVIFVPRQKERS
ncbi:MAG: hypothetical protein CL920_00135 [Deltaproteobacteria bacterium]|nr:hypothetical protein [Deltaproteobacteria bacterium]